MKIECNAKQYSDLMECRPCKLKWDINDSDPPECRRIGFLTDYELGNFILYNIADKLIEVAEDCRYSHSIESKHFRDLAGMFIDYGQIMEDDDEKQRRHAFRKFHSKLRDSYYKLRKYRGNY